MTRHGNSGALKKRKISQSQSSDVNSFNSAAASNGRARVKMPRSSSVPHPKSSSSVEVNKEATATADDSSCDSNSNSDIDSDYSSDSDDSSNSSSDIDDGDMSIENTANQQLATAASIKSLPLLFYLHAKTQLEQKSDHVALHSAVAALQKSRSLLLQRNSELQRLLEKAMKRQQQLRQQQQQQQQKEQEQSVHFVLDNKVPPGSALVQRTVSDDRFLLSAVNVTQCKIQLSLGCHSSNKNSSSSNNNSSNSDNNSNNCNSSNSQLQLSLPLLLEALACFPRSVQANFLLGELLRGNATAAAADLAAAEHCYRKAIETAAALQIPTTAPAATPVATSTSASKCSSSSSSNSSGSTGSSCVANAAVAAAEGKITTTTATETATRTKRARYSEKDLSDSELNLEAAVEEKAAGRLAQEALALLLLQQRRSQEADALLQSLGFEYRLSDDVLCYPLTTATDAVATPDADATTAVDSGGIITATATTPAATTATTAAATSDVGAIVRVVDGALRSGSLSHLQRVFHPAAAYWKEHNYDVALNASRIAGYVSYMFPINATTAAATTATTAATTATTTTATAATDSSTISALISGADDVVTSGADVVATSSTPRTATNIATTAVAADSEAVSCSIQQIIMNEIFPIVCQYFPHVAKETKFVEWWVHTRPHSSGHQLHFDSDETKIECGNAPHHPLVSTVLYLDHLNVDINSNSSSTSSGNSSSGDSSSGDSSSGDSSSGDSSSGDRSSDSDSAAADAVTGGPTLITNQTLHRDSFATAGWLVLPRNNRLAMFDARYLHGVVPGRSNNSNSNNNNSNNNNCNSNNNSSNNNSNNNSNNSSNISNESTQLQQQPAATTNATNATTAAATATTTGRRLTFMVGFWSEFAATYLGADVAGPGQPFPDPASTRYTWSLDMLPSDEFAAATSTATAATTVVAATTTATTAAAAVLDQQQQEQQQQLKEVVPVAVSCVWQPVNRNLPAAGSRSKPPQYNKCFQGF